MTIIAYRDGVLAGDRNVCGDDLIVGTRTKVHKINGWLIGGCGPSEDCVMFRQWCERGFADGDKPKLNERKFQGIAIRPDGKILNFNGALIDVEVTASYFAIGCGAPIASGAMFAGAIAQIAVAAACKHDPFCGGGIDVVTLAATGQGDDTAQSAIITPPYTPRQQTIS